MRRLKKHSARLGGIVLAAGVLSACVSVDVAVKRIPFPGMGIFFVDNAVVDKPAAVRMACPEQYAKPPKFAFDERLEGWVIAGIDISPDGAVEDVTIHASNDARFEEVARKCFNATQFHPAEHEGRPVAYRNHPMAMNFKVDNKKRR
jgi:TonB family protein